MFTLIHLKSVFVSMFYIWLLLLRHTCVWKIHWIEDFVLSPLIFQCVIDVHEV